MSTKAELEARCAQLDADNTVMMLALNALAAGIKPDAEEMVRLEDHRYTLRLFDSNRAHGGIVVVMFAADGAKRPSTHAYYFETYRKEIYDHAMRVPESWADLRDALERMGIVNRQIQRGEAA